MERASRLTTLWSWLPAFRAVAETEHLPSASDALHVSASALSRTIGLLETDVGRPLFDRVGRRIELNDAGREMLIAVRDAMRRVDEALVRLGPGRFVGRVRLSVPGPLAPHYVLPALRQLTLAHPELVPHVSSVPSPAVNDALRQGQIDVAVLEEPMPTDELTLVELCRVPHALCCGPSHPLHGRRRVSLAEICEHTFVAPEPQADGRVPDRWPAQHSRRIGMYVSQMQVGIDACATGLHLAVLPWPVAEKAGLSRIDLGGIDGSTLFVMHRPTLDPEGRTEALVAALRAELPSEAVRP